MIKAADPRLKRVSDICLALPEAVIEAKGQHAAFLVRKKTFAYYMENHHGDGSLSFSAKVLPGDNQRLAKGDPMRYYLPAYIGPKGWVALRLDTPDVDWKEVAELALHSYLHTAPKGLCARIQPPAH